jgi:hypothetical protein
VLRIQVIVGTTRRGRFSDRVVGASVDSQAPRTTEPRRPITLSARITRPNDSLAAPRRRFAGARFDGQGNVVIGPRARNDLNPQFTLPGRRILGVDGVWVLRTDRWAIGD